MRGSSHLQTISIMVYFPWSGKRTVLCSWAQNMLSNTCIFEWNFFRHHYHVLDICLREGGGGVLYTWWMHWSWGGGALARFPSPARLLRNIHPVSILYFLCHSQPRQEDYSNCMNTKSTCDKSITPVTFTFDWKRDAINHKKDVRQLSAPCGIPKHSRTHGTVMNWC